MHRAIGLYVLSYATLGLTSSGFMPIAAWRKAWHWGLLLAYVCEKVYHISKIGMVRDCL